MILINEPLDFSSDVVASLASLGSVYLKGDVYDLGEIEIIFVRLGSKIDVSFLQKFNSLKYVVSPTTGLNHIDLLELQRRKIKIISLKGHTEFLNGIPATAEHTLALALALLRRIPAAVQSVQSGEWNRYPFKGKEINGRQVLVIGYGRVGKQVARLYKAFGAKIMAFDTNPDAVPLDLRVALEDGLQVAEIISIHISYCDKNIGFLSAKLFSYVRPDAILINTSRGEVLDQSALIDCLFNQRLAGAALDVLCDETTLIDGTLREVILSLGDRLIVTPHIAGFTTESLAKVERYVSQLLIEDISK